MLICFWYQDSSYIVLSQIYRGIHVRQFMCPSISLKAFSNLIWYSLRGKLIRHQDFCKCRIVHASLPDLTLFLVEYCAPTK